MNNVISRRPIEEACFVFLFGFISHSGILLLGVSFAGCGGGIENGLDSYIWEYMRLRAPEIWWLEDLEILGPNAFGTQKLTLGPQGMVLASQESIL